MKTQQQRETAEKIFYEGNALSNAWLDSVATTGKFEERAEKLNILYESAIQIVAHRIANDTLQREQSVTEAEAISKSFTRIGEIVLNRVSIFMKEFHRGEARAIDIRGDA
jgi:hypothetical protein